tara:strand:- start:1958 stop:2800 length:843 start_codon:yes stop_codon:yes gene_type:complete
MNIFNAIKKAKVNLKKNFIMNESLDSEILLSKAINKNRKYILLNPNEIIDPLSLKYFYKLISDRSKGKPIAYITETKDFWKHQFKVGKETLIPRPDTEIIIEEALKITRNKSKLRILDIGVGSGCILLSLLSEKKNFSGIGIDISKGCIKLSKINAARLKIGNRVKFFKSDVDNFSYGKYDLIISNPPYIKKVDLNYLEKDIISFEPKRALDGGLDGMTQIKKVIRKSSELIKKRGKLILEIGFDQKEKTRKLLNEKGFFVNKVLKDLAKNDRCIVSTKI